MNLGHNLTILNAGYRSTNYWLVSATGPRLLVDIGWPGTMGTFTAILKRMGIKLNEIRYALATHYHIDHAGLAEEIKREGITLLVVDLQVSSIPLMKRFTKPADHYVEITEQGNQVISCEESRSVLQEIGLHGQIISTPGHSDDSISLLLDSGHVFTGDLPPEEYCWDNPLAQQSWQLLRNLGAKVIYPAHGPAREINHLSKIYP